MIVIRLGLIIVDSSRSRGNCWSSQILGSHVKTKHFTSKWTRVIVKCHIEPQGSLHSMSFRSPKPHLSAGPPSAIQVAQQKQCLKEQLSEKSVERIKNRNFKKNENTSQPGR